jgi:hypothetical protein
MGNVYGADPEGVRELLPGLDLPNDVVGDRVLSAIDGIAGLVGAYLGPSTNWSAATIAAARHVVHLGAAATTINAAYQGNGAPVGDTGYGDTLYQWYRDALADLYKALYPSSGDGGGGGGEVPPGVIIPGPTATFPDPMFSTTLQQW